MNNGLSRQRFVTVYHGTTATFDRFCLNQSRTARHIYTDFNCENAARYGTRLLTIKAHTGKTLDLRAEHLYEEICPNSWRSVRAIWRALRKDFCLDSLDGFVELLIGGDLYNYCSSSVFQDAVVNAGLARGYGSVCITDRAVGGGFSDSLVFGDPDRLAIVAIGEGAADA